jgi:hypothetical protein
MAKQKKSSTYPQSRRKVDRHYICRDIAATNPLKQQFEPTEASPIRQHKRMAGES